MALLWLGALLLFRLWGILRCLLRLLRRSHGGVIRGFIRGAIGGIGVFMPGDRLRDLVFVR